MERSIKKCSQKLLNELNNINKKRKPAYRKGAIIHTIEQKHNVKYVIKDWVIEDIFINEINIRYLCRNVKANYLENFEEEDLKRNYRIIKKLEVFY